MKMMVDDSRLQKRVRKAVERIDKTFPGDLRLSGKRTAFYLSEYTLPAANEGNSWPVANFMQRVADDVAKAYPAKGDPKWASSAYDLILDAYNKNKADEFWRAFKGKTGDAFDIETREQSHKSADSILESARKVKRRIDPSGYALLRSQKTVRRKKAMQLSPDVKPLAIPSAGSRDSFTAKRQSTIGLAKAGYYAADTALGGQRNYKKAENQAGRFIWPTPLRRLQAKFGKGIGTGRVIMKGSANGDFEVHNRVRYADEAIPQSLYDAAIKQSSNAMRIIFELRLKNRATYEITP